MKKLLIVGVIVLFLGLACAPSINANVSRDNELVEITTEICGLGGGKHTVQLTQKEAEEVDRLFETIRQRLNATESREEAEEIFKEAVVELDKYGLLGGLSLKQAQRLVMGKQNYRVNDRIIKHLLDVKELSKSKQNYMCLTIGAIRSGIFVGIPLSLTYYYFESKGMSLTDFIWETMLHSIPLLTTMLLIILFLKQIFPFCLMNTFITGRYGLIFTLGLNGVKIWYDEQAIGTGFNGLKIFVPNNSMIIPTWSFYLIGYTLIVKDYN
jgi:hypothetical protein